MRFNAGHALNYQNVRAIAALPGVRELHIGHAIVSRAVFVGLREAVRDEEPDARGDGSCGGAAACARSRVDVGSVRRRRAVIYGIGTDIVLVERIVKLIERWGDRFPRRVLGPDELVDVPPAPRRAATMAPAIRHAAWPSASPPRRPTPRRSAWGCAGR
jgi:hypothetical protein